jgi:shikimate kinase
MTATLELATEVELDENVRKRPVPAGVDRVVLTGFMGSGKTTVGRALAERLGWQFLDLDAEIERRDGRTVPQIFAASGDKGGEAHFRHLETSALAAVLGHRQVVVALGGGAPEELGNRLLLEQTPRTAVVYLSAPLQTLLARCRQDDALAGAVGRPLLAEAEQRFAARRHLYERIAAHQVETSACDVEQVADAILETLSHTRRAQR